MNFQYPHECREDLVALGASESVVSLDVIRQFRSIYKKSVPWAIGLYTPRHLLPYDHTAVTKELQRELIGDAADAVFDKQQFGDLVTDLGYRAPHSVQLQKMMTAEDIFCILSGEFEEGAHLFAKPVDGFKGNGTFEVNGIEDAAAIVAGNRSEYLVQTCEKPEQDWRYVFHRTRKHLEDGNDNNLIRIVYAKERPEVIGNGLSTVEQLLITSPIPSYAKRVALRKADSNILSSVPNYGEVASVIRSGNISQGAYGRLPAKKEEEYLDQFFEEFLAVLEQRLGQKLPLMCTDIGVLDRTVFDRPYDEHAMKEAITFYEFQVPFGMDGYLRCTPPAEKTGVRKIVPDVLWDKYQQLGLARCLAFSMVNSARFLKQQQ